MNKTVHVFISGRVQGVGYRAWTIAQARALGLHGWVRNCADGRVEALFSGAKDTVDNMLAACQNGPTFSRVTDIQAKDADYDGPDDFLQKPTV